jgi:hypothetical protein
LGFAKAVKGGIKAMRRPATDENAASRPGLAEQDGKVQSADQEAQVQIEEAKATAQKVGVRQLPETDETAGAAGISEQRPQGTTEGGTPFERTASASETEPEVQVQQPRPSTILADVIQVESPERIEATAPHYSEGGWKWELRVQPSGATFCWVTVELNVLGSPRGPKLDLFPKAASLPDGRQVVLKAGGFSWTLESLKSLVACFVFFDWRTRF